MIHNSNKYKIFLLIIAILLVANIAMLAYFLQKNRLSDEGKRPNHKAVVADFLKNEIGFNEVQLLQYDSLSNLRQEKMASLFENMRNSKTEQFKQLVQANFNDSVINALAEQSTATQKTMALIMFNDIKQVRQLCKPGQVSKFDSLFGKIFNRKWNGRKKK